MKTNTLVSSVTDETSLKIIAYYINNEEISKSSQYNFRCAWHFSETCNVKILLSTVFIASLIES